MPEPVAPIPEGYHTVTPYLLVSDADALLAFIEKAFGGETRSRHTDDRGRVMHAEARIGDSILMLGESNEEWAPTRAMLHVYVEDVDRVFRRAVEAGATAIREPEDMPYGDRSGGLDDPWGTRWWLATRVAEVSGE